MSNQNSLFPHRKRLGQKGIYLQTDIAIIRKIDTKKRTAEHGAVQKLNKLVATLMQRHKNDT